MAEYIDRETLIPDRCYYEPYGYEAVSCEQIFHEDTVDAVEREKIDKAIEEIIEKSFCTDIYNDRTDDEVIKLDDVLEILKRNIEGEE